MTLLRPRPNAYGRGTSKQRRTTGAAVAVAGGDLRRRKPHRSGPDRRRDTPDRAGLGDEVQRSRRGWADRSQGARPAIRVERYTSRGPRRGRGKQSDTPIHGVVRWRIVDLCQWLHDQFGVTIAEQTLSRELRAMNYRKLSARPRHHAQAEGAIDAFKKVSPPSWKRLPGRRASLPAT